MAGVRMPRTYFVACETAAIEKVFDETGWRRAVVKPVTGGGGHSVELVSRDAVRIGARCRQAAAGGVLVQEFLPEIADGELSLVYFNGIFSHAIRKRPPQGEFRGQLALRRHAQPPRRRRARWRSRARPRCARCPSCRSMPASTAWCATVR